MCVAILDLSHSVLAMDFSPRLSFVKTPTPTQHNTTVGFDTKMTVQTPPPTTQTFQALLDELES